VTPADDEPGHVSADVSDDVSIGVYHSLESIRKELLAVATVLLEVDRTLLVDVAKLVYRTGRYYAGSCFVSFSYYKVSFTANLLSDAMHEYTALRCAKRSG
jgi:hypothetical protein